jgi:predicted aspartyl protease
LGTFSAEIEIGDPSGSRFETAVALVDTGASVTTLPGSLLEGLGVTPHTQFTFVLADGREIQRPVGRTWIRIGDRSEMTLVVFADEEVEPLLGAYSLQGLMLGVDSPNERLIPVNALMK